MTFEWNPKYDHVEKDLESSNAVRLDYGFSRLGKYGIQIKFFARKKVHWENFIKTL